MTVDFLAFLVLLSTLLLSYLHVFKGKSSKLPPGPFPLPIIGNIHQLGRNPHRSLTKLSKTYGPLMHLKLGTINTVVVSSPEIAKEILQKHDQACSGRKVPHVVHGNDHHKFSLAFLPAGSKWRRLRKICKEEMFSTQKLEASEGLRQEKLRQLQDYLQKRCSDGRLVNIGEVAFVTTLNLVSSTLFSIDFAHFDSDLAQEMKEIVQELMKMSGTPNVADFFPVLRAIDPQGLKRKTEAYQLKLLGKFDEIISKRLRLRENSSNSTGKKDLLEALLDLSQDDKSDFAQNDLKHLLLDLILAGSDTTADSVLWAMAELIRNPNKMSKVKEELRTTIGEKKQVEESDISRLPYLNAVIKESFRRHPPGPFLVPHKAETNVEINGYVIPKDAQILVNVWAIGNDSKIWANPDSFEPERFLGSKIDYRGQDFELITFGSGRRICPGLALAHRMVPLMVASMVHNFDWKLELGMKPEEVDLDEIFGLSLHKAIPLEAFPILNKY